jgi:hypothetical protein
MEHMLVVLAANPAADGAGLVAMTCFIAWPLFQARWMMLTAYICNSLCFAPHYALLGHWTAAAMNGLMSMRPSWRSCSSAGRDCAGRITR